VAAVAALAVAAIALPFLRFSSGAGGLVAVSGSVVAELPPAIAREQRAGTVAVVDFVDFECPHCRAFHGRLVEAMARTRVPVRVVRKMIPLPQHRGALPAAVAWLCADAQGRGDEMAEALLSAPASRLTPAGCEEIAGQLGLDLERYRSDAAQPSIQARLAADMADARAVGLRGLPTVYIGRQVFHGASASVDDLVAALRRAAGGA
jgi:protein-disulfide isomerase